MPRSAAASTRQAPRGVQLGHVRGRSAAQLARRQRGDCGQVLQRVGQRRPTEIGPDPAASLAVLLFQRDDPLAGVLRRLAGKAHESLPQRRLVFFVVLRPGRPLHEQIARRHGLAQESRHARIQSRRFAETPPDLRPRPLPPAEQFRRGGLAVLFRVEAEVRPAARDEGAPTPGAPVRPRGPRSFIQISASRTASVEKSRSKSAASSRRPCSVFTGVAANSSRARSMDCRVAASRATSRPSAEVRNASTVHSRPFFWGPADAAVLQLDQRFQAVRAVPRGAQVLPPHAGQIQHRRRVAGDRRAVQDARDHAAQPDRRPDALLGVVPARRRASAVAA